jgi:hypothetical protein
MARTSSSRRIRYSLSSTFTSEPEYFEQDAVADLHVECQALALVVDLAGARRHDPAFLRLLLRGVGNDDAALADFLLLDPLHQKAVLQRTDLHALPSHDSLDRSLALIDADC